MNGIINVYKEKGYTSHDVVAKLRGILKQKKIGHTGTLDPDAEGVLPVCLGNATKVCELLTDKDKTYEAVLKLGLVTDTQDATGTVLEEKPVNVTEDEVRETILSFVGEYAQIPPMYSALKVNGKKLYELAREGIEVERKAREVKIFAIEILDMDILNAMVRMRVTCSKGTYIRTLCHDIGMKLGCGGIMESLLRTRVDCFDIKDSITLGQIENVVRNAAPKEIEKYILQVDQLFIKYGSFQTKEETDRLLYNGNELYEKCGALKRSEDEKNYLRVYDSKGEFKGIYQYDEKKKSMKPYKMFL